MIGKMYISHSTSRGSANFNSVPFHSASITWERESASTLSFRSPQKFSEADRVRYKSSNGRDFGGQIYKIKKSTGSDYQYECISYLRLYHDKVTASFKNKTSSQIMKSVLGKSKNNFSTSGIKTTTAVHSSLKWENTSIWDIACQLCWLEHQSGFEVRCNVNADGILEFGPTPQQQTGYSFTNVLSYDEEHDSSDLITQYTITKDDKVLATASSNSSLIAKWGYVGEIEECTTTKTTTKTTTTNTTVTIKAGTPTAVKKVLQSIIKAGMTDTQKAKAIFNWFKANCRYDYYYNCDGNCLAAFKRRRFNCANGASLYRSMARSVGLNCRVMHPKGHYYNQVKLNGKWVTLDVGRGRTGSQSYSWGSHYGPSGGAMSGQPCTGW